MRTQTIKGTSVPALGFGTFQLTGDDCERGVRHALDIGYRHIDTAQGYGNEDRVGAALAASAVERHDIFLTTKLDNDNHAPATVRSTTEASLRDLRTDYVDLLLIHWPVGNTRFEATLDAMLALGDEGKVRNVGVSNFTPEQIDRVTAHAPIFANQVEYHPFLGQDDLLALARKHDHLLTAYSPLARGQVFRDDTLVAIGEEHGADPAQVALAWLLSQDHVAAIPEATSPKHITSNFRALDVDLGDDEIQRITALERGERLIDPPFAPW
jgi:diketogulonate reductase-like aldo/keto reductase